MGRWKVFYTDGSTFCDEDGNPWDAPRTGVQVVVTKWRRSPSARRLLGPVDKEGELYGRSYYCWYADAGHWLNHDLIGMAVYLRSELRPVVLFGEYVDEDLFLAIRKRAGQDPYTRLIAEG